MHYILFFERENLSLQEIIEDFSRIPSRSLLPVRLRLSPRSSRRLKNRVRQ